MPKDKGKARHGDNKTGDKALGAVSKGLGTRRSPGGDPLKG